MTEAALDRYLFLGVAAVLLVVLALYATAQQMGKKAATAQKAVLLQVPLVFLLLMVSMGAGLYLSKRYGSLVLLLSLTLGSALEMALLGGGASAAVKKNGKKREGSILGAAVLFFCLLCVAAAAFELHKVITIAGVFTNSTEGGGDTGQVPRSCAENLKALYNAFNMYAQDWGGLPPAVNWTSNQDLIGRVPHNSELHCPAVSNGHDNKFGYAYNTAVAGKSLGSAASLAKMPNASATPLLFDSNDLAPGAHSAFTGLPNPGRHNGKDNVLYLDGHVAGVAPR